MQSALEVVAFSRSRHSGIVALLETALDALDEDGHAVAATHLDMALNLYLVRSEEQATRRFNKIGQWE